MEMLNIEEALWDENHHRLSFLSSLDDIEKDISSIFPSDIVNYPQSPILNQDTISEGNLGNIYSTITIDISIKEFIVENIHLGANCSVKEVESYTALFKEFCNIFDWSYEKMSWIDPSIVVHEIKTYPGIKPVRQKLCPVHPKKTMAIKTSPKRIQRILRTTQNLHKQLMKLIMA
jgi:hypothetical protein